MNARVIRRFVVLMIVMAFVVVIGTDLIRGFMSRPPGDFNTERGTNRLSDGEFADALQHFDAALKEQHDHRGALMDHRAVAPVALADDAEHVVPHAEGVAQHVEARRDGNRGSGGSGVGGRGGSGAEHEWVEPPPSSGS